MANGLTRRQSRKKRGKKKEDKNVHARSLKRSDSGEQSCSSSDGSPKSRLDQMMSSCTCCSSIKGRIIRIERGFGSILHRGQEYMQQQQLSGLARTTILQAYNFCSDYFSIADEDSTAAITAETTPLNGEVLDQSDVSEDCIPKRQEIHRAISSDSLQAFQLNLSPVPEHKIPMSSTAIANANLKSPDLTNGLNTVGTNGKDSTMESLEDEPKLVNESPPAENVAENDPPGVEEFQPSWETDTVPKLRDYSKMIGELPELPPSSVARIAPVPKKTEYMQSLAGDEDAPLTESDINDLENQAEKDGTVQFFLRIPKSKKLRQTRQRRNVERTLSGLKIKSQKQIASLRRQSVSMESDASDRTPKYVAPFPTPLHRDNGNDRSNSIDHSFDGRSPHHERYATPERSDRPVRRMSFVAGSKINRFDSNGKYHHVSSRIDSSIDGRESSVGHMINSEINKRLSNGSKSQRHRSGSTGSKAEVGNRSNFPPQKSMSDADPSDVFARTNRTMISRRGSFVAGSKIEHFDPRSRNFHSRVKEGFGDLGLEYDRSDRRNRTTSSRTKEGLGELTLDNNESKRRHRTAGRRVLSLENSKTSNQMKRTGSGQSQENLRRQSLEECRRDSTSSRRSTGSARRGKRPSSSKVKQGLGNLTLD